MLVTAIVLMLTLSIILSSSQDAFAQLQRPTQADVTLTKMASKTQVIANQPVTFTYTITNSGTVEIACTSLTDVPLGNIPIPGGFVLLNPTQSITLTKTSNIAETTTNTATLTCNADGGVTLTRTASATVTVVSIGAPTIDKSVLKNTVIANQPNQVTITVGGGPFAYQNCVVTDPKVGFTSAPFSLLANTPNQQVFGPIAYSIPATDTNTATVQCFEPITMNNVMASDSETVTVVSITGLTLMKDVDGLVQKSVPINTPVTYNFKATNNNPNFGLQNCQINDPMLGGPILGTFSLAAGGGMNTMSEMVTIMGPMTNTATVTCFEPTTMNPVTATSNQVVVTILEEASVMLVKFASPKLIEMGDTVTYNYDVINNGNIPLDCGPVMDDKLGDVSGGPVGILGPGNEASFMTTAEISVDTKNTAKVICTFGEGGMVMDDDMQTVIVLVVGGEYLPINSSALFLAGIHSNLVWMLPTLAGITGAGFYLVRFRTKED